MPPIDNPQNLLEAAHRTTTGLAAAALMARSLAEWKQIDDLLVRDVFDALCRRGISMRHISEFVWPAVVALARQAAVLGAAWSPALPSRPVFHPAPRRT